MNRPNLTAVVVDDEPLARKRILDLLQKEPDIAPVVECPDGYVAVEAISKQMPDLVFLDVQMPEKDGFQVLAELPKEAMPVIIFVTAYDQYAIRAFEFHAVDYLLKPFDDERFTQALKRAREQVWHRESSAFKQKLLDLIEAHRQDVHSETSGDSPLIDRFVIKERGEALLIKAENVDYIEGEGVYVRLHSNGASHLMRESMTSLEEKLNPRTFFRIHRSTIVNLERVKKLVPHFHGDYIVVLNDGTHLKLSRSRREKLQRRLGTSF